MKFYPKYNILFFTLFFFSYSFSQGSMQLIHRKSKQKIAFESINNLIVIPVILNGQTLSFIVDSGASKTILFGISDNDSIILNNSKSIKLRGLGSGEPVEGIISKHNTIKIKNILGVNQTIYVVLDQRFDLSSRMGQTIHGIIGYDLLKNFVTEINYNKKQLVFYNKNRFKKKSKYKTFDINFHHKKPYINALVHITDTSKHNVKLLIDTGNSDALWLFEDMKKGIVIQNKFFNDHMGEGLSGNIDGKRSKIQLFKMGNFLFKNPTTAFLDSTATSYARAYEKRDGSIGGKILKRFNIILDYPHQQIHLKKTKSFNKDFRYNRAGIEIAHVGKTLVKEKDIESESYDNNGSEEVFVDFQINYKYVFKPIYAIHKIRTNSPAEKAGLKVNDIIKSINGKSVLNYRFQDIINYFYGDAGSKIKMIVERRGGDFYYEFNLKKPL